MSLVKVAPHIDQEDFNAVSRHSTAPVIRQSAYAPVPVLFISISFGLGASLPVCVHQLFNHQPASQPRRGSPREEFSIVLNHQPPQSVPIQSQLSGPSTTTTKTKKSNEPTGGAAWHPPTHPKNIRQNLSENGSKTTRKAFISIRHHPPGLPDLLPH